MSDYTTVFGSLDRYEKGRVEVIQDDARNYAFSNVFEICNLARPYERTVFGINQIYVLEAIRAEGSSPWYTCAHDEFALCMDREVDVHLARLERPAVDPDRNGAVVLGHPPTGPRMGWVRARRGHQVLLPANCAYRFEAARPAVLVLQTCKGELSRERWSEICQLR
jgi:hypothetical protein